MRVTVLGSGANGGIPQWDCCCSNCSAARLNPARRRTRSSVAVSVDGANHLLVDAGPDLKFQLESTGLVPHIDEAGPSRRQSRVAAILLTHGHGDHTVGVAEFSTGKSFGIPLYAHGDLVDYMFGSGERVNYFGELGRLARDYVIPHGITEGEDFEPMKGLRVKAFPVRHTDLLPDGKRYPSSTFNYLISSGKRSLLYLTDIGEFPERLLGEMRGADVVFFDATFWWNDELRRVSGISKTSYDLGHVPAEEAVELFRRHGVRNVVFTHLNHTNPLADPGSPQSRVVAEAGFKVAYDGMVLDL